LRLFHENTKDKVQEAIHASKESVDSCPPLLGNVGVGAGRQHNQHRPDSTEFSNQYDHNADYHHDHPERVTVDKFFAFNSGNRAERQLAIRVEHGYDRIAGLDGEPQQHGFYLRHAE
jgi:hypothetical protein